MIIFTLSRFLENNEEDIMNTEVAGISIEQIAESPAIIRAGEIIKKGGLVAFPTETVYGLGANALQPDAAKKIYQAKGRPSDNPLIIHISEKADLDDLVLDISAEAEQLMNAFWPGPMTLIFTKKEAVPYETTGGLDTVAVRMPDHPIARALIKSAGVPIAAPSANTSGRPSPTTAEHVCEDLKGKVDMILDGGMVGIGIESTIIDMSGTVPVLLRPGAVTVRMITEIISNLQIDHGILEPMKAGEHPKAPGMKYKHYAPKAELTLVEGEPDQVVAAIKRLAVDKQKSGFRVGIICTEETKARYREGEIRSIGFRSRPETIAAHLFYVLREFDHLNVDYIYSESFADDELGFAIMNRLMKAAGYHVIQAEGRKNND